MDLFSQSDSKIQLPYEGYTLRFSFDREAWWGEVFFSLRFVSRTGPHEDFDKALRAAKLKAWKSKLQSQSLPATIVNYWNLAIVFQNIPSIRLFDNLLHRRVYEFLSSDQLVFIRAELKESNTFRTRIRLCDWKDKPFEGEFVGEVIELPDPFVVCRTLVN